MTNMKIIWQNSKSADSNSLNRAANSFKKNSLEKSRNNPVSQENNQLKGATGDYQVADHQSFEGDDGDQACRVCQRTGNLRNVHGCETALQECFGIQVLDLSIKICIQCAELIEHTCQFKDMIMAAFPTPILDEVLSESQKSSSASMVTQKLGAVNSEKMVLRKLTHKETKTYCKNINSKSLVVCVVCKQKYIMMNHAGEFVCSRCKVNSNNDKTVCVTCRAIVPFATMRDHLEKHGKANLKGRCRLRSLTKEPSIIKPKSNRREHHTKAKLQCKRCLKEFALQVRLEEHLRDVHGERSQYICGICKKDLRTGQYLEKHMKLHALYDTFACEYCGKIYKNFETMQKHSASVHGYRLLK